MRWLALTVCLLTAAPALGAVTVKPYGFVLANFSQSWNRPNFADVPTQAVSASNSTPPNQTLSVFTARQTRVGARVEGGKGPWDSDLTGVVEFDLFGLRNAGASNQDVLASTPRLRLAYMQAKKGAHAVVFGQDWTAAFAPLNPTSLTHLAIPALTSSGNLWNRLPQLRWDADWSLPAGFVAGTKLALARSFSADEAGRTATAPATNNATNATGADLAGSGEFSGGPAYQALAELRRKIDGRTWIVGASMQYLRESFNTSVPQPAGALNHAVDGLLGSAHFVFPVLERLELSGEWFYGRSDQNLNGLGTVYNDLGSVRTSQTRGGFAQAQIKPIKDWRFYAMGGFEDIDKTGVASAGIYRNETVAGSVMWDCTADMTLSAELDRIHSYFVNNFAGDAKVLGFAAQYRF